jgi:hypothetical protein
MKNVSTSFGLCVLGLGIVAWFLFDRLEQSAIAARATSSEQVVWTDWSNASVGDPGWAEGTVNGVEVRYDGEVLFAITNDNGTSYWLPPDAYISPKVPHGPRSPDIIAMVGGNRIVHTVAFSEPVTDVVVGIVSMGSSEYVVEYVFDRDFSILSNGPGYWGDGPLSRPASNILRGAEGHGVIMFRGPVLSISWVVPAGEYWHGFTVGVLPALCTSDINGDRAINGEDLGAILNAWGPCQDVTCREDLDGGGVVDGGDLGMLLSAWGECPN